MQVSVEKTGAISRSMTVAIPAEQVEREVMQRLKRLTQTARLPGFRPGKAPLKVIERRFGSEVLGEVAGSLIQSSLKEALAKEDLVPAGGPDVEPRTLARGKDFEYVANFDVFPEIKSIDVQGAVIERPVYEMSDADVQDTIENMRKQKMQWESVERASVDGDQVIIDFTGYVEGEVFAGNSAEELAIVLGEGRMLPDFENGLKAVTRGEEKKIEVNFPDDYQSEELAGRRGDFEVTVRDVKQPVLPEIDAEFVKSFGIEDGEVKSLQEQVRENLKRETDERCRQLLRGRILKTLMEANDIEVPGKLVAAEIDRLIESSEAMLKDRGIPLGKHKPDRTRFEGEARQRVALGLIMSEIMQRLKLEPDQERVRARIETMAATYDDPKAFIQWYYSDRQRVAQMESAVLEDQIVDEVLKSADVQDQVLTLKELTQGAGPTG